MKLFRKKEKEEKGKDDKGKKESQPAGPGAAKGSSVGPGNAAPSTRVFGVSLKRLPPGIPVVLRTCVEYFAERGVDHEGLFRLSGAADEVRRLRAELDAGQDPPAFGADVHSVAALLKLWFRELPEPLLTWELYDPFLAAASTLSLGASDASLATIRKLLAMLPPAHYATCKFLVSFLHRVQLEADRNKMTAANLAVVFGPTLGALRAKTSDPAAVLQDSPYSNRLMECFVENYFALFETDESPPEHARAHAARDKTLAWRTSRAPGETQALRR